MKVALNTVVDIDFIVTDEAGKVIETNGGSEPMKVLIGSKSIVVGLENALMGHEAGDRVDCVVKPEEGYGVRNENLVQTLDKSMFGDMKLNVGDAFLADTSMGPQTIYVKEINDTNVIVDGNHPLADQTLKFSVDIIAVREATESEIKHGHVHGDGDTCCDHDHDHEHEHGCCCGHHHHHDDDEHEHDHKCCGHHHHDDDEEEHEHKCCGHHHHDDEAHEHKCCGKHHHDEERECHCKHKHED